MKVSSPLLSKFQSVCPASPPPSTSSILTQTTNHHKPITLSTTLTPEPTQIFSVTMEVTPAALAKLEDCLLNTSGDHPLHNRFRALFTLKAVGGERAIDIVSRGKSKQTMHKEDASPCPIDYTLSELVKWLDDLQLLSLLFR